MPRGKHDAPNHSRAKAIAAIALVGASAPLVVTGVAHAATQSQWDCIAYWESGGRWSLPYGDADSTGGLQIQTRTWIDYGGLEYAPQAYLASEAEQIAVAERILAGQGPGAWTTNYHCGLTPGGYTAPKAVKHHAAPATPAAAPASPPVPFPAHFSASTHTVESGDSLWSIALDHYGSGEDWTKIYAANRSVVGSNPDLIYPGQILTLP